MAGYCPICLAEAHRMEHICERCGEDRPSGGWVADPMTGQVVAGRYVLAERVGSGGMGFVYRARHMTLDADVAVKILRPDVGSPQRRRRFEREARLSARLTSPYAARVYDLGALDDGSLYLVMELISGRSLDAWLSIERPMPAPWVADVIAQIASALAEAHGIGAVHRDVKPSNIMLSEGPRGVHARLLDFGVAALDEPGRERITRVGLVQGTPRYMSPEQALAQGDLDGRSDLYSLGVIAYELLTGRPLFQADTPVEIMFMQVNDAPPPLAESGVDVPPAFREVVERLLEKGREDRFPSAGALVQALAGARAAMTGEAATVLAPGIPAGQEDQTVADVLELPLPPRRARRDAQDADEVVWPPRSAQNPWRLAVGLVALALASVGSAYVLEESDGPPGTTLMSAIEVASPVAIRASEGEGSGRLGP